MWSGLTVHSRPSNRPGLGAKSGSFCVCVILTLIKNPTLCPPHPTNLFPFFLYPNLSRLCNSSSYAVTCWPPDVMPPAAPGIWYSSLPPPLPPPRPFFVPCYEPAYHLLTYCHRFNPNRSAMDQYLKCRTLQHAHFHWEERTCYTT